MAHDYLYAYDLTMSVKEKNLLLYHKIVTKQMAILMVIDKHRLWTFKILIACECVCKREIKSATCINLLDILTSKLVEAIDGRDCSDRGVLLFRKKLDVLS